MFKCSGIKFTMSTEDKGEQTNKRKNAAYLQALGKRAQQHEIHEPPQSAWHLREGLRELLTSSHRHT